MGDWSRLTIEELERRRTASVEALNARDRVDWAHSYQETCDRQYWTSGQCCAGCDYWESNKGLSGTCAAAGIVSGADVLRSVGFQFSSYMPPPGLPYTQSDFHCGKFRDDFDWSSLSPDYLERIGAMRSGVLRDKPLTTAQSVSEGGAL